MKSLFKNKFGFTLVEIMVTLGIAGGIGLMAYGLLSTSRKTVNTNIATHEISFLKNQVIAFISMPENCMLNFNNQIIGTAATPTSYTSLIRKQGNGTTIPFIEQNRSYGQNAGQNAVTVNQIRTSLSTTKANIMNIRVDYQILAGLKVETTKKTDFFTVEVFIGKDAATGLRVASCFTDTAKMIQDAVRLSCNPSGTANGVVTYNGSVLPYGECVRHNIETRNEANTVQATNVCPPNQFLVKTSNSNGTAGGTTTPGKITYECKTVTLNSSCPAGSYLKEIDVNGAAVCVTVASLLASMTDSYVVSTTTGGYVAQNLNCPAGQVLQKFNNTTGKVCVPKTIANTCPADQYVYQIDASGNAQCRAITKTATACPGGTYVRSVDANGAITNCSALTLPGAVCSGANQVMIAIDSFGNSTCATNY